MPVGGAGEMTAEGVPRLGNPRRGQKSLEVYGFVFWIATFVCLMLFLLWAYLPEDVLHSVGVTYYPNKYWAIAIPAYVIMATFFLVIFYVSISFILTEPLDSIYTITDQHARRQQQQTMVSSHPMPQGSIPPLRDLPISTVNKLLYHAPPGPRRREKK